MITRCLVYSSVAKKAEAAGLPDPDKQQNAEMKSIVAAASDAVRPVQSVVSNKRGDYASYDQEIAPVAMKM